MSPILTATIARIVRATVADLLQSGMVPDQADKLAAEVAAYLRSRLHPDADTPILVAPKVEIEDRRSK